MGGTLTAGKTAVITVTDNLQANGGIGEVTFSMSTSKEAPVALKTGYTVVSTMVTWGSASRSGSLIVGKDPKNLIVTFTPTTAVPNGGGGTVVITVNAAWTFFTANAASACVVTSGGVPKDVESSVTNDGTLSIQMAGVLAAGQPVVATCLSNLEANPAQPATVTFDVSTSVDTTAVKKQTGYSVMGTSVTWTSATRTGTLMEGEAGGSLVVAFTPLTDVVDTGKVTITPSANLFAANASSASTTCTAKSDGAAVAVTIASTQGRVLTVTIGPGGGLVKGKPAVITCTDNLQVNGAAGPVTFAIATSADVHPLVAQTGYTVLAKAACTTVTTAACAAASAGYVYNVDNAAKKCAGTACNITSGSSDFSTCCETPRGTCGDKNSAATPPSPVNPVTNAECSARKATFQYNSANANSRCIGTVCNMALDADFNACCEAPRATCATVSDAQCAAASDGYRINTNKKQFECAGVTCDVKGPDLQTCCFKPSPTAGTLTQVASFDIASCAAWTISQPAYETGFANSIGLHNGTHYAEGSTVTSSNPSCRRAATPITFTALVPLLLRAQVQALAAGLTAAKLQNAIVAAIAANPAFAGAQAPNVLGVNAPTGSVIPVTPTLPTRKDDNTGLIVGLTVGLGGGLLLAIGFAVFWFMKQEQAAPAPVGAPKQAPPPSVEMPEAPMRTCC
jgi:hypothetical protein